VIAKQAEYFGTLGAWIILAASGIFSSAAYVALYQHLRRESEGFALWGLVFGLASSIFTLASSTYQALLVSTPPTADAATRSAIATAQLLPAQLDPKGLATFAFFAIVSFIFGRIIVGSTSLPRNLGYLALLNSLLLVVLFFANVYGSLPLILLSGGLSSVIATPLWWIWLGTQLRRSSVPMQAHTAPAE
jgi:Domain of unknown function (DUF4386)